MLAHDLTDLARLCVLENGEFNLTVKADSVRATFRNKYGREEAIERYETDGRLMFPAPYVARALSELLTRLGWNPMKEFFGKLTPVQRTRVKDLIAELQLIRESVADEEPRGIQSSLSGSHACGKKMRMSIPRAEV